MTRLILLSVFMVLTLAPLSAAREVCRNEKLQQITCRTVNGRQYCDLSYITARVCKEVPDAKVGAPAAPKAETVQQPDSPPATSLPGKVTLDPSKVKLTP